jgi:hypothetical protein
VPAATSIGFLVNPTNPNSQAYVRGAQEAARTLGQQIHILNASTETEIDTAFQGRAGASRRKGGWETLLQTMEKPKPPIVVTCMWTAPHVIRQQRSPYGTSVPGSGRRPPHQ